MLEQAAKTILDAIPGPCVVVDRHGLIVAANRATLRLMETDEARLAGHPFDAFFIGDTEATGAYLKRCLGSGDPTIGSAALKRAVMPPQVMRLEGTRFVLAADGVPMILLHMRPREAVGSQFVSLNHRLVESSREVARRRRAEEALGVKVADLAHADRQKDHFIALLSHELRNPLAPIRTLLEVMRRDPRPEQVTRSVDTMERHVRHLIRLLDDLLDLSRIATGKIRIDIASVGLRDVIDVAASAVRPRAEAKGQVLEIIVPAEIVVRADADRMRQVIGNLLDNACKFTPAGGRIGATASIDCGNAVIRVRDTGPGISPQLAERLFNFFSQGEAPVDRTQDGLGLGLALARSLMELQAGSLELAPSPAGAGAEFVATVPLAPPRAGGEEANASAGSAPRATLAP